MSSFIVIPQSALRFATSDLMLNTSNINTMLAREERDYPLIEFNMGTKEVVQLRFVSLEIRAHFFKFILDECKAINATPCEAPISKSEKKRRSTTGA